MSHTPHGAGQRDHRRITFRELFETSHDPSVLPQPAKRTLDHIALTVLLGDQIGGVA